MKTNHLLIITAVSVLQLFSSCQKENIKPNTKYVASEASVHKLADEQSYMNDLVYKTVMLTFGATVGDVNAFKNGSSDNLLTSCAVITKDTTVSPYQLTIDFGTGCTLNDGSQVSGIIKATYTNTKFITPNSRAEVNLDSFYINGNRILGLLTVVNKGPNANNNLTFDVTVANGSLIYGSDGRMIKQDVSWFFEWFAQGTNATDDDYFSINGTASGATSNGDSYTDSITVPLILSRDPNCVREFIYGVTVAQIAGQPDLSINYGDGTCDTKADATQGGVTTRINLQDY